MFASELDVEALTFTKIAASGAPSNPVSNCWLMLNAAANRCRHSTVEAGDSTVTIAAASPDAWIFVTIWARLNATSAGAALVTVTPALVPTPLAFHSAYPLLLFGMLAPTCGFGAPLFSDPGRGSLLPQREPAPRHGFRQAT